MANCLHFHRIFIYNVFRSFEEAINFANMKKASIPIEGAGKEVITKSLHLIQACIIGIYFFLHAIDVANVYCL